MLPNRKVVTLCHSLSPNPIATRHQCNISSAKHCLALALSLKMMHVNNARLWQDNRQIYLHLW